VLNSYNKTNEMH